MVHRRCVPRSCDDSGCIITDRCQPLIPKLPMYTPLGEVGDGCAPTAPVSIVTAIERPHGNAVHVPPRF